MHRQEGSGPRAVQLLRGACSRPSVRSGWPVWLLAMRKRPLHSTLRWARGCLHTRVKGDLPALPIYTATFVHCAPSPTNPLSGSPWLSGRRMSAVPCCLCIPVFHLLSLLCILSTSILAPRRHVCHDSSLAVHRLGKVGDQRCVTWRGRHTRGGCVSCAPLLPFVPVAWKVTHWQAHTPPPLMMAAHCSRVWQCTGKTRDRGPWDSWSLCLSHRQRSPSSHNAWPSSHRDPPQAFVGRMSVHPGPISFTTHLGGRLP